MEHVFLRRRAVILAMFVALLSTVAGVTAEPASAQTLAPGGTVTFSGGFTDPAASGGLCTLVDEDTNMGVVNCMYFEFTVAATVTPGSLATITFTAEGGEFAAADASVHCRQPPSPIFQQRVIVGSTEGSTDQMQFVVNPNEICEIRVEMPFGPPPFEPTEATPGNPFTFFGRITLDGDGQGGNGGGGTQLVRVSGGGQLDPGTTITTNARPATDGKPAQGNWRYHNKATNCMAVAVEIRNVNGLAADRKGTAEVSGRLKVKMPSGDVVYADFISEVVDGGEGGSTPDTYSIESASCANEAPNNHDKGNLQIHPNQ
jgi:hypothetical protein